jgi:hypothetical protein
MAVCPEDDDKTHLTADDFTDTGAHDAFMPTAARPDRCERILRLIDECLSEYERSLSPHPTHISRSEAHR